MALPSDSVSVSRTASMVHEPGNFAPATDRDAELLDPVGERETVMFCQSASPSDVAVGEQARVKLRIVEVQAPAPCPCDRNRWAIPR